MSGGDTYCGGWIGREGIVRTHVPGEHSATLCACAVPKSANVADIAAAIQTVLDLNISVSFSPGGLGPRHGFVVVTGLA
jgi:hypothetical protein